ncbi:glycosyltransferase [Desulfofustis glycolicus]|uniref:Glycosyltransferase involved in cell wall bisynthesis n=1 Tax=Desulfofustis glycolicus DSM 9705 TaxID=1121409 RepID=A0A1M5YU05_9BACT|nr:glycosyltransferase [Desulfofustis glycolicus]MCB2214750.1 glycosyltransferase [Desulfobulbaceae bacterium]SHI15328.1 Glycosyltransferase involved in cell wall bisynthesis [Desulfofustis glycolicus DSM 9705]
MEYPLVSIVIPTYNQAAYLPVCVDHCLFQTYPNIEIIIVDGGSTDDTKEYLISLPAKISNSTMNPVHSMSEAGEILRIPIQVYPQNRRLKILTFDGDIGATRTYNEGFQAASGKYCTYIVGDDWPHSHMIEEMVGILENMDVDFVYSDMNLVHDTGQIVRQMRMPDYSFEECFAQWFQLGVSKLYKTEWHRKVGLMDESYWSANDYDHYLRFAVAGCRFYHLPRILYSVRWHGPDRKIGQHTQSRYAILMEESKKCSNRARQWLMTKNALSNIS